MKTLLVLAVLAAGACQNTADPPAKTVAPDPATVSSASPAGTDSSSSAGATAPSAAPSASAPTAASATAPDASAPSVGATGDKVYDQTTTAISAAVGDHFAVVVPGNATTSYTWRADPKPDGTVITVADPKYTPQPPPGCGPGCVGYGGTYSFAVTANAAGTGKVHLVKVHVGRAPGTPVQEVSIAVTVK
jgi:predicted secreted protein